jgi:hypothetical protein
MFEDHPLDSLFALLFRFRIRERMNRSKSDLPDVMQQCADYCPGVYPEKGKTQRAIPIIVVFHTWQDGWRISAPFYGHLFRGGRMQEICTYGHNGGLGGREASWLPT